MTDLTSPVADPITIPLPMSDRAGIPVVSDAVLGGPDRLADERSSTLPRAPIRPIEWQIVKRLARHGRRDARELLRELRFACAELPVEPREMLSVLPDLEREFGISLPSSRLLSGLFYVRELAHVIDRLSSQPDNLG